MEIKKLPAHFHDPFMLDGVVDTVQKINQSWQFFFGTEVGVLDDFTWHACGMNQFCVVVVGQNIGEWFTMGRQRIDVRMRVNQRDGTKCVKKSFWKRVRRCHEELPGMITWDVDKAEKAIKKKQAWSGGERPSLQSCKITCSTGLGMTQTNVAYGDKQVGVEWK